MSAMKLSWTSSDLGSSSSTLLYPGGKTRARPILLPILAEGLRISGAQELLSTFMGGGSLEIACAKAGVRVHASDLFQPLTNFWHYQLHQPAALAGCIRKYVSAGVNKETFVALKRLILQMPDCLEKAAVFYVINRLSMYGLTLSGNMVTSRHLTRAAVDKVAALRAPGLSVDCLDYLVALERNQGVLTYLDPPFDFSNVRNHRLYGVNGDHHRHFNHDALFQAVEHRPNWVMSMNAEPHILARYAAFPAAFPSWPTGMSKPGSTSSEVLIFSKNFGGLAHFANQRIATFAAQKAGPFKPSAAVNGCSSVGPPGQKPT